MKDIKKIVKKIDKLKPIPQVANKIIAEFGGKLQLVEDLVNAA